MSARNSNRKSQQAKSILAQEAARIMVDEGIKDFGLAKRKAADRLGISASQPLPSNQDIENAVSEYQRLFQHDEHAEHLLMLRIEALNAMKFLNGFDPRLVGSVLAGTATANSDINLHLFADTVEEVAVFLMDKQVPHETSSRKLKISAVKSADYPVLKFRAGELGIDLTVLPMNHRQHAPLSPVDGKPMQRADAKAVESLLDASSSAPNFFSVADS